MCTLHLPQHGWVGYRSTLAPVSTGSRPRKASTLIHARVDGTWGYLARNVSSLTNLTASGCALPYCTPPMSSPPVHRALLNPSGRQLDTRIFGCGPPKGGLSQIRTRKQVRHRKQETGTHSKWRPEWRRPRTASRPSADAASAAEDRRAAPQEPAVAARRSRGQRGPHATAARRRHTALGAAARASRAAGRSWRGAPGGPRSRRRARSTPLRHRPYPPVGRAFPTGTRSGAACVATGFGWCVLGTRCPSLLASQPANFVTSLNATPWDTQKGRPIHGAAFLDADAVRAAGGGAPHPTAAARTPRLPAADHAGAGPRRD